MLPRRRLRQDNLSPAEEFSQRISFHSMKLSVIICTFNGGARLGEVLRCLSAQQTIDHETWELLIVDNASTDGTFELLPQLTAEFPATVRVLQERQPGKAHALRTAFHAACGEYFCIVDDDNLLDPDYLSNGVQFLDKHSDAALIAGRTLPKFPKNVSPPSDFEDRYAAFLACRDKGEQLIWGETPAGAGQMGRTFLMRGIYQHIGTRLEDRVGEGVGCCEDLEKGEICKRLGWRTAHVPTLRLQHVMSARRLSSDYIDDLTCAAILTGPWLRLIAGNESHAASMHSMKAFCDWCRSVKYRLLALAPADLHPKLKRAPFWRRFYQARANGYLSLIFDRKKIQSMLEAIEASMPLLSPADRSSTLAMNRPVTTSNASPA
jgi:glycosyltransferase involved in cell wall biosynthesis